MGYGSRALQLLKQYYEMKIPNLNEGDAQEPVTTEITNVPDEEVGLLEETIGNFLSSIRKHSFRRKHLTLLLKRKNCVCRTSQFAAATFTETERETAGASGLRWRVFRRYRAVAEVLEAGQFCTCIFEVRMENLI